MSQTGNVESGTVRPAHAARQFAQALRDDGLLDRTWRVKCELHGALRTASREHDVDIAIMLGLEGEDADPVDVSALARRIRRIHDKRELHLLGTRRIAFDKRHHLVLVRGDNLPSPSNGMRLSAFDPAGKLLLERSYQERPCLIDAKREGAHMPDDSELSRGAAVNSAAKARFNSTLATGLRSASTDGATWSQSSAFAAQ